MKQQTQTNKSNEIYGLIYLLISVILGVTYFIPGLNTGPLGRLLLNAGKGLLGPVAYAFPILFLVLAISSFLKHVISKRKIRINHVFLLMILFASLIHALTVRIEDLAALSIDEQNQSSVLKTFEVLWTGSQDPSIYPVLTDALPGGVIGGLIAVGLQRITGYVGSIAILITAILAEAIVIGNFSIERILQGFAAIIGLIFRSVGRVIENATSALYDLTSGKLDPEPTQNQSRRTQSSSKPLASKSAEINPVPIETAESFTNREEARPTMSGMFSSDPVPTYVIPPGGAKTNNSKNESDYTTPDFLLSGDSLSGAKPTATKPESNLDFLLKDSTGKTEKSFLSEDTKKRFKESVERVKPVTDKPDVIPDILSKNEDEEVEEIENLLEADEDKPYEFPPLTLLEPRPVINSTSNASRIRDLASRLEATLASFGVEAKVVHITTGPSITRFELRPGPGVKISKIVGLGDDIALSLAAMAVRIEAPIPGKSAIGIEIPNSETAIVGLRSLLESEEYRRRKEKLLVPLGKDIPGLPIFCDLSKMPHLLIAGATGSGKSISINTILISLLYRCSPKELKLILIDPKVVELSVYKGIPHLLAPVVTDPKKAANTLNWAVAEMTRRYQLFAERQVRDMKGYNEESELGGHEKLPFVVLIIDELSDLMATSANEVEDSISRLTAMARAAGIHLIIATQRPSVDVITGVIKANIPSRVAFAVSSQVDSRTILDGGGAEKLLGKGDMLYSPQSSSKPTRGQGAFVSDHEVENIVSFLRAQNLKSYDKEVAEQIVNTPSPGVDTGGSTAEPEEDELLDDAVSIILEAGYASVSVLQRRLNIGYPRAGRLIDAMEMKGYIGPFVGSKPRQVLLTHSEWALRQAQSQIEEKANESEDN